MMRSQSHELRPFANRALVILGSLTEEEASKAARGYSLSEYTTLELSQELLRRIQASAEVPDVSRQTGR